MYIYIYIYGDGFLIRYGQRYETTLCFIHFVIPSDHVIFNTFFIHCFSYLFHTFVHCCSIPLLYICWSHLGGLRVGPYRYRVKMGSECLARWASKAVTKAVGECGANIQNLFHTCFHTFVSYLVAYMCSYLCATSRLFIPLNNSSPYIYIYIYCIDLSI